MKENFISKFSYNPKSFIYIRGVILFFLLLSPLTVYIFFFLLGISKGFFFYIAMTVAFLISVLTIYEAFIESRLFAVRHEVLDIKGLSKKFRIVFFSDLHVGPFKKKGFVKRVVDKVNSLRADIILIGGDFTTAGAICPSLLTPLKKLEANYPIVAVLGNHDYNINFSFEKADLKFAKKIKKKYLLKKENP